MGKRHFLFPGFKKLLGLCVCVWGVPLSSEGESLCETEAKTKRNGQEEEIHGDIFECLYLATMMGK